MDSPLTSRSLQLLPGRGVAGTMGLLEGGAEGLAQWGIVGETGSILTMAGAEARHTDWERTTEKETGRETSAHT